MEKTIEALKNGGIILYPTDTIWGLGCDATNDEACQKLMDLKNRGAEKSFIVLVDSIQMLERYTVEFPPVCYELIDFATRPLTIIYPLVRNLSNHVKAADGSVGIRVTNDPICRKLIQQLKRPIVSTSANFSGEKSPTCFNDISETLKSKVDGIVMERLKDVCTTPSQVIKIGLDSTVQIIRK
jgi:L-threonylcarbamoyladenylate synthase